MNLFDLIAPIYGMVHSNDEETFKKIIQLGDFKKTDKVLDLGGGTGIIAKFFVSIVHEIVVVDTSKGMLSQCKNHTGINCILGSAENIPCSDSYFDKVIIVDAFHHFKNQQKAVQEIKRVLKENGKVVIEEVNFGIIGNWLIEKLEMIFGAKSKILSPQPLAKVFLKNQFKTKLFDENRRGYYLTAEEYEP